MKKMAGLHPPKTILEIHAKILFKLCKDTVYNVRVTASKSIYAILKALKGTPEFTIALKQFQSFFTSKLFADRQIFALGCG